MIPCKIVQTTATHQMCETCHAKWYVDRDDRQAPCPFPAFARVVLDKIVAEARADERAKNVARLRELAAEMLEVEPSLDDKLGAEALRNAADMLEAGP